MVISPVTMAMPGFSKLFEPLLDIHCLVLFSFCPAVTQPIIMSLLQDYTILLFIFSYSANLHVLVSESYMDELCY